MLDRDEIRSFFGFLDTASDRELNDREQSLDSMVGLLSIGSDARKDVQFLVRKLREEKAARINLQWHRLKRRSQQG